MVPPHIPHPQHIMDSLALSLQRPRPNRLHRPFPLILHCTDNECFSGNLSHPVQPIHRLQHTQISPGTQPTPGSGLLNPHSPPLLSRPTPETAAANCTHSSHNRRSSAAPTIPSSPNGPRHPPRSTGNMAPILLDRSNWCAGHISP